jgi:DNA-binding transcriptional regulator YhcF (GntR family)
MPQSNTPRKRSPAEWGYFLRRNRVLRAIRHPTLTPAAKQILVALSVADDDPFILPERPPVRALARHLTLAERTVRQAITELVEQNCLTFRVTGEGLPPGQGPPADPEARPDLAREWAFLSAARAAPSRAEYLETLARLRDHALAARRIATAVSAERALGRALQQAERMRRADAPEAEEQMRRDEEEAPLAPPDENLELIAKVNADRALAPAARHALIEVMLDRIDNPVGEPDQDHHLCWSQRLAKRHGITPRGARKALAELEDLRLIAQANGDVCVYPDRVEERMRRARLLPPLLPPCDGLDPLQAHRHRLERLRDLALAEGLVSTAVSAQLAIGRVLDHVERQAAKQPDPPKPPVELPQPKPADVLPTRRNIMDSAPDATAMLCEVLAEVKAEMAAQPPLPSTAGAAVAARL